MMSSCPWLTFGLSILKLSTNISSRAQKATDWFSNQVLVFQIRRKAAMNDVDLFPYSQT